MLRFLTCGSVDDGKSTLVGRLLYEAGLLLDDQLAELTDESKRIGSQDDELVLALVLDGLAAEREQGITIDVAHRYFTTERRKFVVADAPGHEQYTRNMVTAASTADCAVVLVDVTKGVLTQTRRHSYLLALLGVQHVAVAVNKMDLVGWSEHRFRAVEREYLRLPEHARSPQAVVIPVSGLRGDNVVHRSERLPWYDGPTLLEYLETVEVDADRMRRSQFRFPVQWVNRTDGTFRGFAGTVAGGEVEPGDRVVILPSGRESTVERVVTFDGDLDRAIAGQSVTLTLTDEIDVSRGDLIAMAVERPAIADQFEVSIVWMSEEPLLPGRDYLFRLGATTATATVTPLKYKLDVDSLERLAARTLSLNEIGVCGIDLDRKIAFDAYAANRETGGFVLIDRLTNETVGAGLIRFALRRSANVHWQSIDVDKASRAALTRQRPCVVWLTGLSGAGKSTIANLVERRLHGRGYHTYLLDGDNVRHGLNKDLGFTDADRVENIRRVGEVAKLMVDAGLIVIASFISPFRSERLTVRGLLEPQEFVEVFVDAPLATVEERDPKGLYRKARAGELKNFTGVDSPYEPPDAPEVHVDTSVLTPDEAAERVIAALENADVLEPRG